MTNDTQQKTKTFKPLAVANTIIENLGGCDPAKLQKLCYLVHGWSMVTNGVSMLNEKPHFYSFRRHIFPSLSVSLASYGDHKITGRVKNLPLHLYVTVGNALLGDVTDYLRIVEWVCGRYGYMDKDELDKLLTEDEGAASIQVGLNANITTWSKLPVQAEVIADEWVMAEFRRRKMLLENG